MNKLKKCLTAIFFAFVMLISVFVFSPHNTLAASGGFALKPGGETTDTVNIDNGSYYINGEPGQTVDLKLLVINQEDSTRQFMFNVNTAYTSDGGQLGYDKVKVSDPSLKIQTRNTASPKSGIFKIPGNATATISFKITIPKKNFKGTIMGGATVYPYKEKAKGTVGSNGTLIKNKFTYSIPIQIHQKNAESEEAKYSVTSVRPSTVISGNKTGVGVKANIHNSKNAYTGNLTAEAIVTQKGNKDFKIVEKKSGQAMAPTSNYDFSIPWGKKKLQSGNYHLKLTYKTTGGIKSWVLNKDFSINNNDAAKYNKLAGIKPNYLWLYIILGILALAIILGLGIYLGRRNNNKNNNNNNGGNTTRRRRR